MQPSYQPATFGAKSDDLDEGGDTAAPVCVLAPNDRLQMILNTAALPLILLLESYYFYCFSLNLPGV